MVWLNVCGWNGLVECLWLEWLVECLWLEWFGYLFVVEMVWLNVCGWNGLVECLWWEWFGCLFVVGINK